MVTLGFPGGTATARARSIESASKNAVAGHIQVSLSLPRSVYPRNALVRVTVEARNMLKPPRLIYGVCSNLLSANVLDNKGNVTYTSDVDAEPGCGEGKTETLQPGGTIKGYVYVVLRSTRVVAVANLIARPVTSPTKLVRLTAPRGPQLVIQKAPHLFAKVRAYGINGRTELLYMWSSACRNKSKPGTLMEYGSGWSSTVAYLPGIFWFSPGCDHPFSWQLIAGFVGQSVVEINRSTP